MSVRSDRIPSTCAGCGCAGFSADAGCKACGFGSRRVEEETVRLPSARNVEEREALFAKLVEYAIASRDVAGVVRALSSGTMLAGSPIAAAILEST